MGDTMGHVKQNKTQQLTPGNSTHDTAQSTTQDLWDPEQHTEIGRIFMAQ